MIYIVNMPSDQFHFVMPRARATGCRPISPGLVHCRQLILELIEVICGNCLNAINNGSACLVLFLNTPGLFPALRKTLEHSTASRAPKIFLRAGNNPVVLINSTEHAEPLFIALFVLSFFVGMGTKASRKIKLQYPALLRTNHAISLWVHIQF